MSTRTRFGKYTVVRRLGAGGMAEVFKCRLSGLGGFDKLVVVKRILPHLVDDPQFINMFLDEARIAANLSHPNIIQIYEIDEVEGIPYIAMEYVKGPTLAQLIRESRAKGPANLGVAAKVVAGLCEGLHSAHNALDHHGQPLGLVHRDVSPQNVIVSLEGVPKLLDFGVAKSKNQLAQTNAGTVKGKLKFMAPEQFLGRKAEIGPRVDVFAAGVCLYQATTFKLPYKGDSDVEVMQAAASGVYPKPSELVPGFPPKLEEIILWAMAPKPEDRCPDAHTLHDALESYARDVGAGTPQVVSYLRELFPDPDNSTVLGTAYSDVDVISSKSYRLASPPPRPSSPSNPSVPPPYVSAPPGPARGSSGVHARSGVHQGSGVHPGSGVHGSAPRPMPSPHPSLNEPVEGHGVPPPPPLYESAAFEIDLQPQVAAAQSARTTRYLTIGAAALVVVGSAAGWFYGRRASPPVEPTLAEVTVGASAKPTAPEPKPAAAPELVAKAEAPAVETAPTLDGPLRTAKQLAAAKVALAKGNYVEAVTLAQAVLAERFDEPQALAVLMEATELARRQKDPKKRVNVVVRTGTLTIETEPKAQVFVNGRNLGWSPIRRQTVPEGLYKIRAEAPGQEAVEQQVRVAARRDVSTKLQLKPVGAPQVKPPPPVEVVAAVVPEAPPAREPEVERGTPAVDAEPEAPPPPVAAKAPPVREPEVELAPLAPAPKPAAAPVEQPKPTVAAVALAVSPQGFDCPDAGHLMGALPPKGRQAWCEADGEKHGKFVRYFANGRKQEEGEYRRGKKHGRWVEYYEEGGERERKEWRKGVESW